MKTFTIMASLVLAVAAAPAFAAKPVKDDAGTRACLLTDVAAKALACTGFFEGNLLSNNKDDVAAQKAALGKIGLNWDGKFALVSKIDSLKGNTTVDFSKANSNPITTLYGDTWIGLHFGKGSGLGDNATGFWKIDAGMAGLSSFLLNITKGSSGAVLYSTQSAPKGGGDGSEGAPVISNVPEPASWAMLIAGFGLVGATMRRRRTAVA